MSESHSITQARLHELFNYHQDGYLIWKIQHSNSIKVGSKVGSLRKNKSGNFYVATRIDGINLYVHRLVFMFHHGRFPKFIDHIDGNGANNKIENLREATKLQNNKNRGVASNSSTGVTGVHAQDGKWRSRIRVGAKLLHLGIFESFDLAVLARKEAEQKYFKNWARNSIL